jgi:hypothetical protein
MFAKKVVLIPPIFKDEQALQEHLRGRFGGPFLWRAGSGGPPSLFLTATFRRIANPVARP